MPYAYGNNKQRSKLLFANRKFYDTEVLPPNAYEPTYAANRPFIDLFIDKPFYGRIDNRSFSVVSGEKIALSRGASIGTLDFNDKRYMKKFKENDVYAMNFVVDAFNDMSDFYNQTCQMLPDLVKENVLLTISPRNGWYSPVNAYNIFKEDVFKYFFEDHYNDKHETEIKNFETFTKYFMDFLTISRDSFSIVFSNFMISRAIGIDVSGLAIEVDVADPSDDYIKTAGYLTTKTYSHFLETAKRFGFFIDRNVPWRLIANLSSAKMVEYMSKYSLEGLEDVFKKQFVKSSNHDLFLLRDAFIDIYKMLVMEKPTYNEYKEDYCGTNTQVLPRENLTKEEYYAKYPLDYWLKIYTDLRALNIRKQPDVNLYKQSRQIFISSGMKNAIEFIDRNYNFYGNLLLEREFFTTKFESVTTLPEQEPHSGRR